LILLLVVAIGLLHLAFLPPWEGYDETAHWSYIQELADNGSSPHEDVDHLSGDVDRFAGPMPYVETAAKGHITYRQAKADSRGAAGGGPTEYTQGHDINWEAQHPPLYYLLMTPFYRLSSNWGWRDSFLVMRVVSWSLAVSGLAIASIATLRLGHQFQRAALATSAWPLIAPEFFPEMARIGNDSLCLFILSIIWVLVLYSIYRPPSRLSPVLLGCALGAGLLTKAFFIPIGVGTILVVIASRWRVSPRDALVRGITIGVVACGIGIWWYVLKLQDTGTLGGGHEFIQLHKTGGLLAGLEKHFSLVQFLWGLVGLPLTFTWPKTWSYVSPHAWLLLPFTLLCFIPLLNWFRNLPKSNLGAGAPAFFIVPMLAGLVYHILACIALYGSGTITPGWYLHVIAPVLAFAWSIGWTGSFIELGIAATAMLAAVPLWLMQLSLFSGCAGPNGVGHITWASSGCFIDLGQLSLLTLPWAAVPAIATILVTSTLLLVALKDRIVFHGHGLLPGRPLDPPARGSAT
jgi:hypothetical protein